MSKANIETLNNIHDLLATHYVNKLKSGELTPAELTAVNNFLKQNDISADIVESKPMMNLVEEMKDTSAEELMDDIIHFG